MIKIISDARRGYLSIAVPCLVGICLAIIVFLVNGRIVGPMIQPDEGSYLSNAAAIAGYFNNMATSYHAGYSLLIAPAFLDGAEPGVVWLRVKIINALLYGLIVIFLWALSLRWQPVEGLLRRILIVVAVALYPMWPTMAGYSFAQIAFVPASILLVILIFDAGMKKHGACVLSGVVAGFMYWIHPTGVVAIIAASFVFFYLSVRMGNWRMFALFLASAIFLVVSYEVFFAEWLHLRMTVNSTGANHYPSAGSVLNILATPDGRKKFLSVLGGHLFYISIGSLGLVVAGALAISVRVSNKKGTENETSFGLQASGAYACLSLVGIVLVSSMFMAPGASRLDHWIYGRYMEGYIAPILLAGMTFFSRKAVAWSLGVAIAGAFLLSMGITEYQHTAPFNVAAFWQEFYLRDYGIWLWLISGGGLICAMIILPIRYVYLFSIVFFLFCSVLQLNYHSAESKVAGMRSVGQKHVRGAYQAGACVGFDRGGLGDYSRQIYWYDFGFWLYDYNLRKLDPNEWLKDCEGPLFSFSGRKDYIPGAHVALLPARGGVFLWERGGRVGGVNYPLHVKDKNPILSEILKTGWHVLEDNHVWSMDSASIGLPIAEKCATAECQFRIIFGVFGAAQGRTVAVNFKNSNEEVLVAKRYTSYGPHVVDLPLASENGFANYVVEVENAISPRELSGSSDKRLLGVALLSLDLISQK